MQDKAGHTLVKGSQQGDGTVTSSYTPNGRPCNYMKQRTLIEGKTKHTTK